ncbi:MAG TPA: amino acid adenylation domain-containing protein, partial [Thermoanaerobaculia bacterium]|nr:amino acid adenylation domain-containing protein [Thermoanaerobaculia bacterium]
MAHRTVEDVYPLSPLQQGLLYDALAGRDVAACFQRLDGELRDLDAAAFRGAWERLLARHAALRTAFVWERRDSPRQVVLRRVEIPWTDLDWSACDAAEQEARLARLLDEDSARGFDLGKPPLVRFVLIRLGGGRHWFLWSSHHLILDGWSVEIVLRELAALYGALHRGEEARLPPARPFGSYIAWLRRRPLDAAEDFWRRQLAGLTAPTDLRLEGGAARRRQASEAPFAEHLLALSLDETAALNVLARRCRVVVSTVLQGAWALLLSRYSGERDVVFGLTSYGRPDEIEGASEIVGVFINTLPLRLAAPARERPAAWLRDGQRRQLELLHHDHAPLVAIQDWSDVPRGRPLFDTVVALSSDGGGPEAIAGLPLRRIRSFQRTNFLLTVQSKPGAGVALGVAYDRRRLEDAAAARLVGHLRALLASLQLLPERPLGELSMLAAGERQQVLVDWNDTGRPYPREAVIQELLAGQAARRPDAVAVAAAAEMLTYGGLEGRANRLAHLLRRQGIGVEDRVGVCLERSPDLVVALLAVLKAGAAYVPLPPHDPPDRVALLAADCGVAAVITAACHAGALASTPARRLVLDDAAAALAAEPETPPAAGAGPQNLAYVLYTSGSTGRPKGVAVPHRAVVRLVRETDYVELGEGEVVLQLAPAAFDASTFEIWGCLLGGGRLVLAPPSPTLDQLAEVLARHQVSVLWLTAGLFHQMVDERPQALLAVRQLLAGGEALSPAHVNRLLERFAEGRGQALVNGYGPTEGTTFSCCRRMAAGSAVDDAVPIGRPIANSRAYVLDREGLPAGVGVEGELHVAGDGLARGYLGRPEQTAERFVPNPLPAGAGGEPGGRLYRTGDRARWLASGEIEFRGRADGQLKLRGFRVEPGEIEAALGACPEVAAAAVIAREDRPGDRRLVAYVVRAAAGSAGADELVRHLHRRLPAYMVPAAFVFLDRLPLTRNGKLDRASLPAPAAPAAAAPAPSAGPFEQLLAGIWAEVLGVPAVGPRQGFIALGGHSLAAIRVAARVRDLLGVDLALRDLLALPTLADVARRIEQLRGGDGDGGQPPPAIGRAARGGDLPLSFAQERLWFLHQLLVGSAAYHVPSAWRLRGELSVAALARGLDEIRRRHEALRTVFPLAASGVRGPVQRVLAAGPQALPRVDLRGLPASRREAELRRRCAADAAAPFDLERGPLLRARLYRVGEDEHAFALTLHHIAADGWSVGILLRELEELYRAGAEAVLPELPLQYVDFAVWQRGWLAGDALARQLAFWTERLRGVPSTLDLPLDRPRPAVRTFRGASCELLVPAPLAGELRALARGRGTTLFLLLLAAYQLLLGRLSRQARVAVGTPVAGRGRLELEGLVGFFANTLVLTADVAGGPAFVELLAQVTAGALDAFAHQDLPFERLVSEMQPARTLQSSPLFQAMFGLQTGDQELRLDGASAARLELPAVTAKFDLTLGLMEAGAALAGELEYSLDLYEAATARRWSAQYVRLLEAVAAAPERRVGELP